MWKQAGGGWNLRAQRATNKGPKGEAPNLRGKKNSVRKRKGQSGRDNSKGRIPAPLTHARQNRRARAVRRPVRVQTFRRLPGRHLLQRLPFRFSFQSQLSCSAGGSS